MPTLGISTCSTAGNCPTKQVTFHMVKDAIDVGYRHIDTAYIYGNEIEVGQGVDEKISLGTTKREDLFISTKLWNTFHSKRKASEGIKYALDKLQINYIDLMLIHWPMGYLEGSDDYPKNSKGEIIPSNVDYMETWEALEEAVQSGTIKSIGVSNFNEEQIKRLFDKSKIKPSVNQIESHPRLTQQGLIDACKGLGVVVTAYSPFADGRLITDATLKNIGSKHGKTAAQVMVKYQLQRGITVIPKAEEKVKMEENFNVFDFTLTEAEMKQISDMNLDLRYIKEEEAKKLKDYPFIPY